MQPILPLNRTSLVFIPPASCGVHPAVAQVTISTPGHRITVSALASYYLAQYEVSELVAKVITVHIQNPLPRRTLFIGGDYTLLAERKEWKLAHKWQFQWGDEELDPTTDKWTFVFRPSRDGVV